MFGPPQPAASHEGLVRGGVLVHVGAQRGGPERGQPSASAAVERDGLDNTRHAATIAGTMDEHVVIVGAGPAGLAAAWPIRRACRDPLVLEQADAVAASWRGRHDHLRLNTHRAFSHQPGARIPRRCGPYPVRDDYVAYLQEYSAGMRLRLGTRVHRIDRTDQGWELALDRREPHRYDVVIATGSDAEPFLPDWPGLDSFGGTVIHAGKFSATSPRPRAGTCSWWGRATPASTCSATWLPAMRACFSAVGAFGHDRHAAPARWCAVAPGQHHAATPAGALAGRHGPRRAAARPRGPGLSPSLAVFPGCSDLDLAGAGTPRSPSTQRLRPRRRAALQRAVALYRGRCWKAARRSGFFPSGRRGTRRTWARWTLASAAIDGRQPGRSARHLRLRSRGSAAGERVCAA